MKLPATSGNCPVCGLSFSFIRAQVSYWKGGEKKDICLECGTRLVKEGKEWKI